MGEALGKLYVERHFPPEPPRRAWNELVRNLLEAYREGIDGARLDGAGDQEARRWPSSRKFTPKIGYPDKWRDYSTLEIQPRRPRRQRPSARARSRSAANFAKLGKPVDRDEWCMTPQTVNAYYNPSMNEIVFPAAILQPPFFDPKADDAVNYGAIGAVIGHEIGHGFDDQGAKYDGDGNLRDWWTDDDRKQFEAKTKKLVEQYDARSSRPGCPASTSTASSRSARTSATSAA